MIQQEKRKCVEEQRGLEERTINIWVNDNFSPLVHRKSRPSHDVFIPLAGVTESLPEFSPNHKRPWDA